MFIGRTQELKQLEDAYRTARNTAVVLYGRYGIGKTALARRFMKEKPAVFYTARELSEQEQCFVLAEELGVAYDETAPDYYECFKQVLQEQGKDGQKVLFVLDEFHLLVKTGHGFLQAFMRLLNEETPCMFLFLSSSVNWVENSMVEDLTIAARSLSGIVKLREFSFAEVVSRFPNMPVERAIYAEAVLGGVPEYLRFWEEKESIRENMVRIFFEKDSPLLYGAELFLKRELRELGAYNAILATLASGKYKLNDIYARTGFSRAKISVYIKNLIELDVVEKVFSFDATEHAAVMHANVQKGLYRIKDRYLAFWYRYVFPNLSAISCGRGEKAYMEKVAPHLAEYMQECFAGVCTEFLKLMGQYRRLKHSYTTWGTWYGKAGKIDIVAGTPEGDTLVGFCRFDEEEMTPKDLTQYMGLLSFAMLSPKEIYLFSKEGFSERLRVLAKEMTQEGVTVTLIGLEDL